MDCRLDNDFGIGINPAIVECKVYDILDYTYYIKGINPAIVECKVRLSSFQRIGVLSINPAIVECKGA